LVQAAMVAQQARQAGRLAEIQLLTLSRLPVAEEVAGTP
jgi:hypothetical protein